MRGVQCAENYSSAQRPKCEVGRRGGGGFLT